MSSIDSELERMEQWISGLMAGFEEPARRKAAGQMARHLRGANAKRIAAQVQPDGSAFEARKPRQKLKPRNTTKKFLYPSGGSGEPRVVVMKSWVREGSVFKGYDIEAGGIRSFTRDKIIKWLTPTAEERNKGAPRPRRPSIKQRSMFRRLRTYSHLKASFDASSAEVGYSGRSGRIARTHQEGGLDKPSRKAAAIRYARRQLLGLSKADEQTILSMMIEMADPQQ